MFKYADDTYIVIPAARSGVNWNWIVQTGGRKTTIWDLTGPNRLKSYSQTATASVLKVCFHRYRTFDAGPPSRCLASPWRIISLSASTSATLSASARSHCTPWNCCVTTAWSTSRWGTSTRPSSSPSCCMHRRHGEVLPAPPISNVSKHLYDVLSGSAYTPPTIPRRLNWLLTWTTTPSRTYCTILAMFCTNVSQTKLIMPTISDLVVTLCH